MCEFSNKQIMPPATPPGWETVLVFTKSYRAKDKAITEVTLKFKKQDF